MKRKYRQYAQSSRVSVGVDVHKISWSVAILESGELVKQCTIPGNWSNLKQLLEGYDPAEVTVSYEAGYFGYHLHDDIESWGGHCVVVAPNLIPQESGNRVKIDRKDSLKLGYFLSKELLKPIYVPPKDNRAERQLIRTRSQLMEDRRRVQCRIKSMLSFLGIECPEASGWTKLFVQKLKALSFEFEAQTICFQTYLQEYENITGLIYNLTREIKKLSETEKFKTSVDLLKTAPGIGTLSGMEFLLEIGDLERFETGDQLAAYVGLTPSQYSSGEKTRMGRITKSGKKHLRATLIEAAWTAIGKDPSLKEKYFRIKLRSGAKRAIVAIARNLLIRLRILILTQSKYQLNLAA